MLITLISIIIALVCYLFIPIVSASQLSRQWKKFRSVLVQSEKFPVYTGQEGENFRVYGRLEAIEEQNIIWLRIEQQHVRVRLKPCFLYVLSDDNRIAEKTTPVFLRWENVDNLVEGINFFVAGKLKTNQEPAIFEQEPDHPLLVIIHETQEKNLLASVLRSARLTNPFWNYLTAPSLLTGMILELVLIFASGLLSLNLLFLLVSLAVLPCVILFPPGIVFFFAYRKYWQKGNGAIVDADVESAINERAGSRLKLKKGRIYQIKALAVFALGTVINLFFANVILYLILLNG